MKYKVEICGVNTSQLKVLKEDEKRELFQKMKTGTSKEKTQAHNKMIARQKHLLLSKEMILNKVRRGR